MSSSLENNPDTNSKTLKNKTPQCVVRSCIHLFYSRPMTRQGVKEKLRSKPKGLTASPRVWPKASPFGGYITRIMDLKVRCEQQLGALAVIGYCTFLSPMDGQGCKKSSGHGGSSIVKEELGEYIWGTSGPNVCWCMGWSLNWLPGGWIRRNMYMYTKHGRSLQLGLPSLRQPIYVASFHPPSSIAKHVKLAFWSTIQVALMGRPLPSACMAPVFEWCMGKACS